MSRAPRDRDRETALQRRPASDHRPTIGLVGQRTRRRRRRCRLPRRSVGRSRRLCRGVPRPRRHGLVARTSDDQPIRVGRRMRQGPGQTVAAGRPLAVRSNNDRCVVVVHTLLLCTVIVTAFAATCYDLRCPRVSTETRRERAKSVGTKCRPLCVCVCYCCALRDLEPKEACHQSSTSAPRLLVIS